MAELPEETPQEAEERVRQAYEAVEQMYPSYSGRADSAAQHSSSTGIKHRCEWIEYPGLNEPLRCEKAALYMLHVTRSGHYCAAHTLRLIDLSLSGVNVEPIRRVGG